MRNELYIDDQWVLPVWGNKVLAAIDTGRFVRIRPMGAIELF